MGKTPAGKLVNMLSNDLQRFDTTSNYLHYIWIMPIQAVAAIYVMHRSVGTACLAGMAFMAIEALPLQGKIYFREMPQRVWTLVSQFHTVSQVKPYIGCLHFYITNCTLYNIRHIIIIRHKLLAATIGHFLFQKINDMRLYSGIS